MVSRQSCGSGSVLVGLATLTLGLAGCADGGDDRNTPWNPEDTAPPTASGGTDGSDDVDDDDSDGSASGPSSTSSTTGSDPSDPSTTGGSTPADCSPGAVQECICPDGLNLGDQVCAPDGMSWGPCDCEDVATSDVDPSDTDSGSETGSEESDTGPADGEVCYPGEDGSYTTCFELVTFDAMPDGYDYPEALNGQANYRRPIALIDLEAIDPDTKLSPNFALDEIAQISKGRYAIVQPHAVESLQNLRDAAGAIGVNSGYRSPGYNAGISGSATYSRHMYGDGFDLAPSAVSINQLEGMCVDEGGMLVEYNSHVHCDFRHDDLDEGFYGAASGQMPSEPQFSADIEQDHGVFTAPAFGFDEGEPLRRWTAYDAAGDVLLEAIGPVFVAPAGTADVSVRVGAQVEISATRQ